MVAEAIFRDAGLAGAVALVSGGSRGIGRAVVEQLAAEGADVTFFYRTRHDDAAAVVAAARERGQTVTAEAVDVRDAAACDAAVARLAKRCGRIDVLVNNSGIVRDGLLGMLADRDLGDVLATNVGGALAVTRAVVPHMIARRAGTIITVSSVAAEKGGRGQVAYAASKGALNAFTRALAVELAPRGIRVNAVAPGVIDTELSAGVLARAGTAVAERILLRRVGTADEVAQAVTFLASRHAGYITGHILAVDGGFKME
jgi:3-oxoacyl-[acyl-carrier protein] reductase